MSFGSVTYAGAGVRSTLTTVAATIMKRAGEAATHMKRALDLLAQDAEADPYPVLFPSLNPP